MIEQLFGSKTRVKLLQLFYSNPNRSFYVREITRKIDEQINSVRRELANLLSVGIIKSDNANNHRLYYEVNQKYEYYKPLSTIFGKSKGAALGKITTVKVDDTSDIKSIGNIELATLTGQFTRDESSGIDLLIVGDVNQTKAQKFVSDMEEKEGKEIRFVVMDVKEYEYRKQIKDRFLSTIMAAKKQMLIDKHNELEDSE
jgi:Fe2+ or Zn2+ uptake regulation protein